VDIEYEDKSYPFDLDDLTVKQAIKIQKHIGGPMSDFQRGIVETRAECYQALAWLILCGGDSTPIADVDFKFGRFVKAFNEAAEAEVQEAEAAEVQEGPTAAAGSSGPKRGPASKPSGSATSAAGT
jgi:hypothetical protein